MLSDKSSLSELIDSYSEWWNQNFSTSEFKYQQMLKLRAGVITEIIEEVQNPTKDHAGDFDLDLEDPTNGLTKHQHIPKAKVYDPSDNYFIGSYVRGYCFNFNF